MLEWGCHALLQGILPNPRNQTQLSSIATRFFTVWANREGQERWGNTLRVGQENSAQWADDFQAKSNKFKPVWTSYSTFPQHLYSTLWVLNWWPNEEMMPKWFQPSAFRHTHKNKYLKKMGFPGGSVVKNPPAKQETQVQSLSQEDPWRKKWQPTPIFLPGKSHGWKSLVGYSPWGHTESDTT